MMKRVLVTGASGFVGRACLQSLENTNLEIHAVASNAGRFAKFENVSWHCCDLLDGTSTQELVTKIRPEYLLHAAWCPAVPGEFWKDATNSIWVRASLQLLEAFAKNGGERAALVGTCAEYDWGAGLCVEQSTPLRPATPYGNCKLALFLAASELAQSLKFSFAWGRLFFLYGPHEHPGRLVASTILALLNDQIAACTDGRQQRDFLHVEDAADALVALLLSEVGGAINIASGKAVSIKTIVTQIAHLIGEPERLKLGAIESSPGDPALLVAEVARLRDEVLWSPKYDLHDGLQHTIEWWKKHHE